MVDSDIEFLMLGHCKYRNYNEQLFNILLKNVYLRQIIKNFRKSYQVVPAGI